MKKYLRYILPVCLAGSLCTSCTDFFETDSDGVLKTEGQRYQDETTARAGLFGLLQGLQRIGDNYVIMGELRGDLMDVTENSSQELRDISRFEVDAENSYLKEREYYSLINNCNYYIHRLDTTISRREDDNSYPVKILRPYMAQAKTLRAWCYLQLCLDYGRVKYADEPFLDVSRPVEMQALDLDGLLPVLIRDLEGVLPWMVSDDTPESSGWIRGNADPGFAGSVQYEGYTANQLMLPVRFVLGELYMWNQDFQKAAQTYYDLIYWNQLYVLSTYVNSYNETTLLPAGKNWTSQFSGFSYYDILTAIPFTDEYTDNSSALSKMFTTSYVLAPSQALIDMFDEQSYSINTKPVTGDLRGAYGTYYDKEETVDGSETERPYVDKYNYMQKNENAYVVLCRTALVYLRYAEAVNRLGKPKLAFYGVLKYGLSKNTFEIYNDLLKDELTGEPWIDFGLTSSGDIGMFDVNSGLHGRGCGSQNLELDPTFVIEACASSADTLLQVEDKLLTEDALETSLEGNRFHDLMRVARYRNDPSWLADKVAAKFPEGEREAIRAKLLNRQNWYLPTTVEFGEK